MDITSGQMIGNYELIERIGLGGFAQVWAAKHIYLDNPAALKIFSLHEKNTATATLNEAKTLMKLSHHHIVELLDFTVSDEGYPVIIMERAAGTVRSMHARGKTLSLETIVPYVDAIAIALQYAHDNGVIHRDVKPENMLVRKDGTILLSDFGIAATSHTTRSMQTGSVVAGTLCYSAPEQLNGNPVFASDQYALAVVIYEWLTGTLPFTGTADQLIKQILTDLPLPPNKRVGNIPPELTACLMKALSKKPTGRYPSILAFRDAVVGPRKFHPQVLTIKAAGEPVSHSALTVRTKSVAPGTTLQPSPAYSVAWSPDARHLAVGAWGAINIYDPSSHSLEASYKHGITSEYSLAWSTNSQHIAIPGKVFNLYSQQVKTIGNPLARTVAYSPNGLYLATGDAKGIVSLINLTSGKVFKQYTMQVSIHSLSWSPDSNKIAMGNNKGKVEVHSVHSNRRIHEYAAADNKDSYTHASRKSISWSPKSDILAFGTNDKVTIINSDTNYLIKEYMLNSEVRSIVWSSDGRYLAIGSRDGYIRVYKVTPITTENKLVTQYKAHVGTVSSLTWSPDTRYIASVGADRVLQMQNFINPA